MNTSKLHVYRNEAAAVADAGTGAAPTAPAVVVPEGYKRIKFNFKEQKIDGKKTGVKRKPVELNIKAVSYEEILAAVAADTTGKVKAFIEELANDAVYLQGREQVNANENITQESLDESKLTLLAIATLDKKDRRGAGIDKETWADFKADYIAVMTAKTDKPLEKVELAADLFLNRLQKVKTMKEVVAALRDQLAIWFSNTEQKEEFMEVYEFLDGKADTFMKADANDMLTKLGAI